MPIWMSTIITEEQAQIPNSVLSNLAVKLKQQRRKQQIPDIYVESSGTQLSPVLHNSFWLLKQTRILAGLKLLQPNLIVLVETSNVSDNGKSLKC